MPNNLFRTFLPYTRKVLMQVYPDQSINVLTGSLIDQMIMYLITKICDAMIILHDSTHGIMTSRLVQSAIRMVFPGELAKHSVSEGTKAVTKYTSAKHS